jgi:cytoskeletal protein CcmA (bactofilin family)
MSFQPPRLPIIPAGASFEGTLCWRGSVRVEGRLTGECVGRGGLEIGPEARVEADVAVDHLVVAGHLEGDASARTRIELLDGACVVGDLSAPVVVLADGAQLRGRLQITPAGPEEPVSAPLSP